MLTSGTFATWFDLFADKDLIDIAVFIEGEKISLISLMLSESFSVLLSSVGN